MKNINDLEYSDKFVFKICNNEFQEIKDNISILKLKYNKEIDELYMLEKQQSIIFNFDDYRKLVEKHKKLVISIIDDVFGYYKDKLSTLDCVFLSGSFARGTNKMSSDLDLHIFYKDDNYNLLYEEIACYTISKILNKSRDCIDPTFILNFSEEYKKYVTCNMSKERLKICIESEIGKISYYYNPGKKRRFYLQYNNSRNTNDFKKYVVKKIKTSNLEWVHCFEVLYGREKFMHIVSEFSQEEKKLITSEYIKLRIHNLISVIDNSKFSFVSKKICKIKKEYQSEAFEMIYEYISILRLFIINNGYKIDFLNLYEIYDLPIYNDIKNSVIEDIYKYLWSLNNLTIFCYENHINYGLHSNDLINYDLKKLYEEWENLKIIIKESLNEMEDSL